eukprot:UN05315
MGEKVAKLFGFDLSERQSETISINGQSMPMSEFIESEKGSMDEMRQRLRPELIKKDDAKMDDSINENEDRSESETKKNYYFICSQ